MNKEETTESSEKSRSGGLAPGATSVRFMSFPKTKSPPTFVRMVVDVFRAHESVIGSEHLEKGLESDAVLAVLANDLRGLTFEIEESKKVAHRLARPVFFGEDGRPTLLYAIDG